jgi:predicted TIM-barrel fold metal-dependent hydrolase
MQTPWGDAAVNDGHLHFFSRRFFQSLGADPPAIAETLGWTLPGDDPAELARTWAAELDRHGVARAALIASTPGDGSSVLAAAGAVPGRFYAYAMVNPVADDAAVPPGLNAICLFPAMHRYSMNDARILPLLDRAAAQNCAVFVHCGVLTVGVRKKLGLPCPFDMRFSNPIDLHPVALRYPQIPFLVPHFGAGYLREALMLADLCPNVYLDTSSSNSWMRYEGLDLKTVFRRALDVAGAGRLIFGTDSSFFPRGWNREVFDRQCRVLQDLGIGNPDARLILGENLVRIFS